MTTGAFTSEGQRDTAPINDAKTDGATNDDAPLANEQGGQLAPEAEFDEQAAVAFNDSQEYSRPQWRIIQRRVGTGVDGDPGPATARAIAEWQREQGLPATGKMDTASYEEVVRDNVGEQESVDYEGDPRGKISALAPQLQGMARNLLDIAHGMGLKVWIVSGVRTFAEQDALYAQGRTKPGNIVTGVRGGGSYHNYGLAIDVVFDSRSPGGPWGEANDWEKLGQAGEMAGFEWGGRWTSFVDRPHFQMPNLSTRQLRRWYAEGGMQNVWAKAASPGSAPAEGFLDGASPTTGGNTGGNTGGTTDVENEDPTRETQTGGGTYTVRRGDSLWKIANDHDLSVAELMELNGLTSNTIQPGQQLIVSEQAAPEKDEEEEEEPAAPAPEVRDRMYTVQSGDSLWKIAARHEMTVDQLKALNGLTSNTIHPGQELKVGEEEVAPAPVQEEEPAAPAPEPTTEEGPTDSGTYTVVAGDSLWRIANAHDMTVDELKALNGLTGTTIQPGDVLKVRGSGQNVQQGPTEEEPTTDTPTEPVGNVPRPDRSTGLQGQDPTVLMAMNLYAEARGEWRSHGTDALYAIGNVVMARAKSGGVWGWPGTPSGVITQPAQFSWTNPSDPNFREVFNPSDSESWETCYKVAADVIGGGGANPFPTADHYFNPNVVRPSWHDPSKVVGRVGNHIFLNLTRARSDV